ncbi:hypothetical protein BCR44DRAFT_1423443, partial [Catenaria anguillulae PL171]
SLLPYPLLETIGDVVVHPSHRMEREQLWRSEQWQLWLWIRSRPLRQERLACRLSPKRQRRRGRGCGPAHNQRRKTCARPHAQVDATESEFTAVVEWVAMARSSAKTGRQLKLKEHKLNELHGK